MANKQQTAVQMLVEHMEKTIGKSIITPMQGSINLALKMEREQTINDYNEGVDSEYEYHINSAPRVTAEQYYNQTYSLPDSSQMRELTEQEADILDKTFKNYYKKSHSLPDGKPE